MRVTRAARAASQPPRLRLSSELYKGSLGRFIAIRRQTITRAGRSCATLLSWDETRGRTISDRIVYRELGNLCAGGAA